MLWNIFQNWPILLKRANCLFNFFSLVVFLSFFIWLNHWCRQEKKTFACPPSQGWPQPSGVMLNSGTGQQSDLRCGFTKSCNPSNIHCGLRTGLSHCLLSSSWQWVCEAVVLWGLLCPGFFFGLFFLWRGGVLLVRIGFTPLLFCSALPHVSVLCVWHIGNSE